MNSLLKKVLAASVAVALLSTTACGSKNASQSSTPAAAAKETAAPAASTAPAEKPDPYSKMSEPVKFTTGRYLPADPKLPAGETVDKNDVVKWCEDNLNIKAEIVWTTSDQNYAFENKINMLIASNDIPDVLKLNVEPYGFNILRKLVDADMIQDMKKVYDDYASPTLKEFHQKCDNAALKEVTFNGKLMAIPSLADTETAIPVIWARQDWLDKAGLPGPKTVDDVANIIKAFKEKDPGGVGKGTVQTYPASQVLYKGDTATFDFVFGAYNSYPGDWIKGSDGSIVYGSVQPEIKAALAKLQDMYKNGIIDKEFALKDADKAVTPVKANKLGLFQGAWWSVWWPLMDAVKNDPNAKWNAFFIKSADGKAYARSYPIVREYVVVKKGYKHPQAIMKMVNWYEDLNLKKVDWYNQMIGEGGKYNKVNGVNLWPVPGVSAKYLDEISRRYKLIMDVVEGRSKLDAADPETKYQVEKILADKKEPMKDIGIWCQANQWTIGAKVFADNKIEQKFPAFSGSTELMTKKKAILEDLEKQTFLNIIMGKASVDEFDKFVAQWKSMGGDDITKEINQIVKK